MTPWVPESGNGGIPLQRRWARRSRGCRCVTDRLHSLLLEEAEVRTFEICLTWWWVSFSTLTPFTATTRSPARSPDASAGDPGSTLRMNCPLLPFSPCRWNPYPLSPFVMRQSRGVRSLVISYRLKPSCWGNLIKCCCLFSLLQNGSQSSGWRGERHILPVWWARIANSQKLQAPKNKMHKRKHKFSTIYGSGTDAKCPPDRMFGRRAEAHCWQLQA